MQKIIHLVNINAVQEEVFEAIATGEGLSNWWSTKVKSEENVGGIIDFTFQADFNPDMKITKLNKPEVVHWVCLAGHEPWQDNRFSFELKKGNGATQLKFTQEYTRDISEEDYGTYNFNWAYYLMSLKEYCETGKGKPFDPK